MKMAKLYEATGALVMGMDKQQLGLRVHARRAEAPTKVQPPGPDGTSR
jgi:hypothetical protein